MEYPHWHLFLRARDLYVSVSGVASPRYGSMLRYEFCMHALIVLAFLALFASTSSPTAAAACLWDGCRGVGHALG